MSNVRLTFRPFESMLDKARALPVGARRRHGDHWFKKTGAGDWKYDGPVEKKTKTSPVVKQPSVALRKDTGAFMNDIKPVPTGTVDKIRQETLKRDRFSDGQMLTYIGHKHKQYKGKSGKLVAMGNYGAAMVKMPDGKIINSRWTSLEPVGDVEPYSLYDGLSDKKVFATKGEVSKAINDVLDKKIGQSGVDYRELATKFQEKGFNLMIVGGTVRDILQGKEANDVDFIVDCSDNELKETVGEINPQWTQGWVTNAHIGLVSFTDAGETVDITPVHKYSPDLQGFAKGWRLDEDAKARDFSMNSLQIDPMRGLIIDGTGAGVRNIKDNVLEFCNPEVLKGNPRYTLRAFKFIARGYKTTPETQQAIKDNIKYTKYMKFGVKAKFLKRQIADKDGINGLDSFKSAFRSYSAKMWDEHYEGPYKSVRKEIGG